ncbi:MAG: zinc ABC transporter ATP-binding protein ZnuC [Rhodospirillales bacterium]|nr:zinc ABC transporter ATP-binding protein ZnuC [Rhodospirillales bacterium]
MNAAPENAPLVRARAIDKRFASRTVLRGVDLAAAKGEIVTLIGPNGAGKTVLLRILLGLLPADGGEVWLKPGLRVGYVPQRVTIDETFPLSVRRFLELGRPAKYGDLDVALSEVGAARLADAPVQGLSGGEMQRVLLARALLRDPELLVLDEPAQGVDVIGQQELFALIVAIRDRRGCGVLMVSHDLHLVMAATDTVVCLNQHVCCTGGPETVSRDPAYLALFGAQGAGAFALYTHHHDHAHDAAGRVVSLRTGAPDHGHDHDHNHDHPHAGGHRHG